MVDFSCKVCIGYAVDDISGDACESMVAVDELFTSRDLGGFLDERTLFFFFSQKARYPGPVSQKSRNVSGSFRVT